MEPLHLTAHIFNIPETFFLQLEVIPIFSGLAVLLHYDVMQGLTFSMDSPDCLPIPLSTSVFTYYFFLFLRFSCWFCVVDLADLCWLLSAR